MPPRLKSPVPMGHYVREWRQHRKLTLLQVATAIGSTKGHLSSIETGRHALTSDAGEVLAKLFGIDAETLRNRTPEEGVSEEQQILSLFRCASPDARKAMLASVQAIAKIGQAET